MGDKAQYHIEQRIDAESRKLNLEIPALEDIINLLPNVKTEIKKWCSRYKDEIEGDISDKLISDLKNEDSSVVEAWRLLLYALLHNHGENEFKPYSFLVSLSHGDKKYRVARHFANRKFEHGIVCVYILNENYNGEYITAKYLKEKLADYGVKWFDDRDNEIMLMNALFPHYIVGFFEIRDKVVKRFILNNWFYLQMKVNSDYDFSQGVYVDQGEELEKFMEAVRRQNLRTYAVKDTDNDRQQFVAELDSPKLTCVPKFDNE